MPFKVTDVVSIIAAGIACIGAVVAALVPALYAYTSRDREMDIKLVEIGISILRADPKEAQTNGAREWAIEIIEQSSKKRFSPQAKSELLQYQLGYADYSFSPGYDCTFTPAGKLIGCKSDPEPPSPSRSPPPKH